MTAQDRALGIFEPTRPQVLAALRAAAVARFHATRKPVSVNDIRHVLDDLHYQGDQRILGSVFALRDWEPVKRLTTTTNGHAKFGATRQAILAYRLRDK